MTGFCQFHELRIHITNIEEIKGIARIAVFTDAENFKKKVNPADSAIVQIKSNTVTHIFNLDEGLYAVAVYQDENNDGQLNKRAMGIPEEAVGFSNLHKKKLKPPGFKESALLLQSDTTLQIQLFKNNKNQN
jgi:uncharacterized protein (DUF2141 family)